ncbi:unnamed protein product (macronuclear) [Paramecium tetraurelia]|uniref:EF-hand domain-containing protein n=1 Tax=Paramecium tetraurelia TaxID=5888 RepID=A0E4C8_PARTE|nr:uncharacterized protein GSPATT00023319001 [Paramecium tetraurelia]CAK90145.1 unnamed protein product [Paramecium tetraurelia]|eukprot:XP_001457542.1 hypothetical protein (macronuclear) [Paramecium tetraurelia strain d4-2]
MHQRPYEIGADFGIASQPTKKNSAILENLGVSNNELEGVHKIQLQKLLKLDLSFNRITGLILGSKLIQHLNLENNKLLKIDFLNNLKDLRYLNLGGNLIEKIDFLVFNVQVRFSQLLSQLEELNIRRNKICTLKGSFSNTKKLKILDASNNRISDTQFIDTITELEELNLSYNQISVLKIENQNENLNILDLSYNQIDDLRVLEFKFPYLTNLYVQSNQIYAENCVDFLKLMSNLIDIQFQGNPFSSREYEDKFIVDCPWLELINGREVGKPGQYIKQEVIALKEKLQELDIDVNNYHMSDLDNEEGIVTEERLKAILRVQGFQDDEDEIVNKISDEDQRDENIMAETEFIKFVTEQNEQMDNIRAQYLRRLLKTQQSECSTQRGNQEEQFLQDSQLKQQIVEDSNEQAVVEINQGNKETIVKQKLLIRSLPKPQKKQSILSEISQLKQNMKSKEFYQSLGFNQPQNRNRGAQQRMNLSSENFNKSSEIRSSSSRPQMSNSQLKLPKI